jgi:HSP20 family protein
MDLMKTEEQRDHGVQNARGNSYRTPTVDLYETDDAYLLYYDVPGVEKEDISVSVEKNVLLLRAECRKNPGENFTCLRDEMVYSSFRRSFDLGNSVDAEGISAEYADGTLKLTLPKKEEQKTRQISISVA